MTTRGAGMNVRYILFFVMISVGALACEERTQVAPFDASVSPGSEGPPRILALSTYSAALGTPVGVHGENFPLNDVDANGRLSYAEMHFRGVFTAQDGVVTAVDSIQPLRRGIGGRLTLGSLGPYAHPFADRRVIGFFEGTMQVRFYAVTSNGVRDQLISESEPQPLEFEIEPSVFIRRFAPVGAECAAPVKAALGGLPYELVAEAVGFVADGFRFTMEPSYPLYDDDRAAPEVRPVHLDVVAVNGVGHGGLTGSFRAPRVPPLAAGYVLNIKVEAHAVDGGVRETGFSIGAYNPIVVYEVDEPQLVQTFRPVPIGGCMEGYLAPITVSYTDSRSETFQRTESRSDSSSFSESLANGQSVSLGETSSDSTQYSTTATETSTEGTTESHEIGVEFSGPSWLGGPKVSYKSSYSQNRTEASALATSEQSTATLGFSETSTDSTTLTRGQSRARTASVSESQSSTTLTSQQISAQIFPGTGGLWYRQASRYVQRGVIVRYHLCGGEERLGETSFPEYRWAVELAVGPGCTPEPRPNNLQPAACYGEPSECDGV